MRTHDLAWTAPQPFWTDSQGAVVPRGTLARPQILRFATDDFMPELLSQLERDPAALPQYAVYKETWRGPAGAAPADAARWLERDPPRIAGIRRLIQQRARAAGAPAPVLARDTAPELKLYQPAHQRHYLVAGALVCRTPGLPDRQVDPARQKVSFVLRRLFPKTPVAVDQDLPAITDTDAWDEHAFVPQGKAGGWRKVGAADDEASVAVLAKGEERLAMFPSHFLQDDGHPRRLYIGSVPVGRREAYQAAAAAGEGGGSGGSGTATGIDPRLALFHTQVLAPWKAMVTRVMRQTLGDSYTDARPDVLFELDEDTHEVPDRTVPPTEDKFLIPLRASRSSLQTSSWYLLLDLAQFLHDHVDENFLAARPAGAAGLLYDALNQAAMPTPGLTSGDPGPSLTNSPYPAADVETNLISALKRIHDEGPGLEAATTAFQLPKDGDKPEGWPDFLFLFADPWFGPLLPPEPVPFPVAEGDYLSEKAQARIDHLGKLLQDVLLTSEPTRPLPEPGLATLAPVDMRDAWYVMRLVYERPDCAPFEGTVVSAATQPFRMAGFFDPDAPARPIRIGLPLDISPAGLRKFDKNTAFMLSDMLCGQVDRIKGITLADLVLSVLPWPFHKDLAAPEKGDCKTPDNLSLGVMCSLSIPIVTICALLLLMIIVTILDYFFRWMPYFIFCFPLPGFKGRKGPP